jgi:hypothetical protein
MSGPSQASPSGPTIASTGTGLGPSWECQRSTPTLNDPCAFVRVIHEFAAGLRYLPYRRSDTARDNRAKVLKAQMDLEVIDYSWGFQENTPKSALPLH